MTDTPRLSVLVTTYNKERELGLVLEGYRHQTFRDFELIVADDGSGEATKAVIEEARGRAEHEIVHSWQEDDGFRAARSRNLAIAKARGELVVMTDGDCIPMPDFLETVNRTWKPRRYLAGERLLLEQEEAAAITRERLVSGEVFANPPASELARIRKIRRKNKVYRALRLKVRPKVMTCNFVASKADLEEVNGFDERYVGWGHEDTDLGRRLRRVGVTSADALSEALVLHLWHKSESSFAGRVRDCPNAAYFDRGFLLPRCRRGLVDRPWQDLKRRRLSSAKHREVAAELGAESGDAPEVAIQLVGPGETAAEGFPKGAEVKALVLAKGATASKGLRSEAHLLIEHDPKAEDPAAAGIAVAGGGPIRRGVILEEIDAEGVARVRAALDAMI